MGRLIAIGGLHLNSFVPQPVSSFTVNRLAQIIRSLGIFLFIYRNIDLCARFIRHFVKMLFEILPGMRRFSRLLGNLTCEHYRSSARITLWDYVMGLRYGITFWPMTKPRDRSLVSDFVQV